MKKKYVEIVRNNRVLRRAKVCQVVLAISIGLVALSLTSCQSQKAASGYNYDKAPIEDIKQHKSTLKNVINTLGTPTTQSDFGPKSFIYIGSKYSTRAFLKPKLMEQKVIVITFNSAKVVDRIRIYTLDDRKRIRFVKEETIITGNEVSLFKQMLSNLGRFKSSSVRNR